ncbi:flippase [bacterium 1xD8-6]|nr:flippase [bacterium D16-36]RKI67313.1 flippase [bacterium 1xD8-6]
MSSIRKNFAYSISYQVLIIILPLITSPYVSRVLGASGLGAYAYTNSITSFIAMFGLLGINNHGNRTIAALGMDKDKRSDAFWNIWAIQALFTTITLIAYIIYIIFLCKVEYQTLFYIEIMIILSSLFDINWFFFGIEKFKLTMTRSSIIMLLSLILIFLLVRNKNGLIMYTIILAGGILLSNLLLWPYLRNEISFVKPSIRKMLPHLKPIVIMFLPVLGVSIYKRMDKIMLGFMTEISEVGLYENAEKTITMPMGVIAALGNVMLPKMSFLFANNAKEKVNYYMDKSMEFTCCISSAMAFGIASIANCFCPIFFGEEFLTAGKLIMILSPTIIFISWASVIKTQYLIPLHRDKEFILSVGFGAIANLVFNIILIPKAGAQGAALGTFFAELIVMLYQSFCVRNELPISKYLKNGRFYFFAGIVMYTSIKIAENFLNLTGIPLIIIEIGLGGTIYCILCGIYIWKHYNFTIKTILIKKARRQSNK